MGEYSICKWFQDKNNRIQLRNHWRETCDITAKGVEQYLEAFANFDGNPQGLRIITRLQWFTDHRGMNLTCPLIGAYTKYIAGSAEPNQPFKKKMGFFPSEEETVKEVWKALGLKTIRGLPAQRHPLAFVMEAADDIAYCLSDIEDGLEKEVLTEHDFLGEMRLGPLQPWVEKAEAKASEYKATLTKNGTYHFFRLFFSQELVNAAAQAYLDKEDAILDGGIKTGLLESDGRLYDALTALKTFAGKHIYTSREAIDVEIGGLTAIRVILDSFLPILLLSSEDFKLLGTKSERERFKKYPFAVLLYSLLPEKQLQAYQWQTTNTPGLEPIHRAQLIVDYLSGMTDSHALKVYNMINGTSPISIE
jgi:dGTPase